MQRLIDGRVSISPADSAEDIAAFFAELRCIRSANGGQAPGASDGSRSTGATPPPVSGGKS